MSGRLSSIAYCDGSSECPASEHIEGCFRHHEPITATSYARVKHKNIALRQELRGAVEALQEAADYLRHDEPDAAQVVIERACEVLGVDHLGGGSR